MENVNELNLEEMEKVSGGSTKTIKTRNATVRLEAGLEYGVVGTLSRGTQVKFTGTVSYNEKDEKTWYLISSPLHGWVTKYDLGV